MRPNKLGIKGPFPKGTTAPSSKGRWGPDKVFGERKALLNGKLPLVSEIGGALALQDEVIWMETGSSENQEAATESVTQKVLEIYGKMSIPTKPKHKVREKIRDLWRMRRESKMDMAREKNRGQVTGDKKKKKKNGKTKKKYKDIA